MPPSPADTGVAPGPRRDRALPARRDVRERPVPTDRTTGWLLLAGGLLGLAASFVLAVEKYALLADPATSADDARYARAILAERRVSYSLNARPLTDRHTLHDHCR